MSLAQQQIKDNLNGYDDHSDSDHSETSIVQTCWLSRLQLSHFRNYAHLALDLEPAPVVLTGQNGSGKTNLLEAVSLLNPGAGLRRATYAELNRMTGQDDHHDKKDLYSHPSHSSWTVSADVHCALGPVKIGTGLSASPLSSYSASKTATRIVRIDGETVSGSSLADYLQVSWLTPAMDGLFTGPASERRRFLDSLISCFDPAYRKRLGQFERAMRQRNKLLDMPGATPLQFEGLEVQMAEIGVAIAAARLEAIRRMTGAITARKDAARTTFPWAKIALSGDLEEGLLQHPAVDVEDAYIRTLASARDRDRAAKRTLKGPHRSDFLVEHGPKAMPAAYCSTGEQKALLTGLILAHAELVKQMNDGMAPLLLLDEIAAHFDEERRAGLFSEILSLGGQAWMTGTDFVLFSAFGDRAQFFTVDNAKVSR